MSKNNYIFLFKIFSMFIISKLLTSCLLAKEIESLHITYYLCIFIAHTACLQCRIFTYLYFIVCIIV